MFQSPARPPATTPAAAPPSGMPQPPSRPMAPPPGASEFTQMFQSPAAPGSTLPPKPPAAPVQQFPGDFRPAPPPPAQRPAAPPPQQGPGEFTRIFQATAPPGVTTPPKPPASPAQFPGDFQTSPPPRRQQPEAPPRQDPGAFTRMFQSPAGGTSEPPPMPAAPSPSQKPADSGEFTRFFQAPLPESRPGGELLNQPPPAVPSGPGTQDPGAFTRLFGARTGPGAPAPPPPSAPPQGTPPSPATNVFATPRNAPPAPMAPPAAPPQGAGEYTRLFSTSTAPPAPAPSGASAAAARSTRARRIYKDVFDAVAFWSATSCSSSPGATRRLRYASAAGHASDSGSLGNACATFCIRARGLWHSCAAGGACRAANIWHAGTECASHDATSSSHACPALSLVEFSGAARTSAANGIFECGPLLHSRRPVPGRVVRSGVFRAQGLSAINY